MDDRIVVVDDDPGTIHLIGRILDGVSELLFATTGEKAIELVQDAKPDLILLDAQLPGISGFKVFDTLRSQPDVAGVPIIFISCHNESGFEVSALNMGAADYIAKPFSSSKLLARVRTQLRMKHASDELQQALGTDALTGIAGRRKFDEALDREWHRGLRVGDPLTLMLLEVDDFAAFTEQHDRQKADVCLQRLAQAIKTVARRPADFLARCGGDQFGLVLPQTPREGAEHIARRILENVRGLKIGYEASGSTLHLSARIGISSYDPTSRCWAGSWQNTRADDEMRACRSAGNLLLAADKALLAAKMNGSPARFLDIADLEEPQRIRTIAPV
jgi:diguanylate cyclase (GGDEF)-like protein